MIRKLLFASLVLALSSCTAPDSSKVNSLEYEVYSLKSRVKDLEDQLNLIVVKYNNSLPKGKKKSSGTSLSAGQSYGSNSDNETQSGFVGECTAITRKGTRCLRKARSNGLCWQHGG